MQNGPFDSLAKEESGPRVTPKATLDTFEFEASAFYKSHGYTGRSQADDFPAGHAQDQLAKEF